MITEFILSGVIVALIIERILYTISIHKQFNEFSKALIARSATDLAQANVIEKLTDEPKEEENPDVVLADSMSAEDFDEMIGKQVQ
jgi:hypothetical protein